MAGRLDEVALMAYADGQLSVAEVSGIERALADDPDAVRRLDALRAGTKALKAIFASGAIDPMPPSFERLIREYCP